MANALWPDLNDVAAARKACQGAAVCAFLVAGITALVAVIALSGKSIIPGIDAWALVDAAIFALLGFFLRRCSRIAAVITLALFIVERVSMMASGGIAGLPLALILVVYFIGGARGAFAYHRLQAAQQPSAAGGTIGPR
jgi:hypothetical protein